VKRFGIPILDKFLSSTPVFDPLLYSLTTQVIDAFFDDIDPIEVEKLAKEKLSQGGW
jgi:hypothetical protein